MISLSTAAMGSTCCSGPGGSDLRFSSGAGHDDIVKPDSHVGIFKTRIPFRVLIIRVPYYIRDLERGPNLENYPCVCSRVWTALIS